MAVHKNRVIPALCRLGAACVAAIIALTGCTTYRAPGAESGPVHPLEGRIWSVREGAFIDYEDLAGRLLASDHVLLGEIHINPEHHRRQQRLIGEFTERDLQPAIVFEIFERDRQADIDKARTVSPPDPDQIADAARLMDSGWDWPAYRPLVAQALREGLPIVAGNASGADVRRVAMEGLDALPDDRRELLQQATPLPAGARAALMDTIVQSHCGHVMGEMAGTLVDAQRLRDATMADAMLSAGSGGSVLIAGSGHARRDYGAPFYLLDRNPTATLVSISFVEVSQGADDPAAYVQTGSDLQEPFDVLWFTARTMTEDPCKQFRHSLKKLGQRSGQED